MNNNIHRLMYISLLVAQGVIIGLIENSIPSPFGFAPGAKLGLANLITIIAIFTMPKWQSFLLVLMRIFITFLLGGVLSAAIIGGFGAILSYFGMLLVKSLGPSRVSIIGISAVGGFLHNLGQLTAVSIMIARTWTVMMYLPILSFLGILSGIAIGIAANYLLRHVYTIRKFQADYEQKTQQNWQREILRDID